MKTAGAATAREQAWSEADQPEPAHAQSEAEQIRTVPRVGLEPTLDGF